VKQVWILANRLRWIISETSFVFAAAGVEVLDEQATIWLS